MLVEYNLFNDIEIVPTNQIVINNSERAEADPIVEITFTAAAASFKITNQEGKFVKVIKSFTVGQKLVINFEKQSVELNGVNILKNLDLASRFFKIRSSVNTYTIDPLGVGETIVKYTPKYL